jgi:hypothetical protein
VDVFADEAFAAISTEEKPKKGMKAAVALEPAKRAPAGPSEEEKRLKVEVDKLRAENDKLKDQMRKLERDVVDPRRHVHDQRVQAAPEGDREDLAEGAGEVCPPHRGRPFPDEARDAGESHAPGLPQGQEPWSSSGRPGETGFFVLPRPLEAGLNSPSEDYPGDFDEEGNFYFLTNRPWRAPIDQIAKLDRLDISQDDLNLILGGNALRLFNLKFPLTRMFKPVE